MLDGGAEDGERLWTLEEGAEGEGESVVGGDGEDAVEQSLGVGHLQNVENRGFVYQIVGARWHGFMALGGRGLSVIVLGLDPLSFLCRWR